MWFKVSYISGLPTFWYNMATIHWVKNRLETIWLAVLCEIMRHQWPPVLFFSGSHCHTQGLHITNIPLKIAAGTHFHDTQHGTKHGVFTCWWRTSLLVAITKFSLLYQATHYNQKTPISASWRWQVRSAKAKKGSPSTLSTSNHLL